MKFNVTTALWWMTGLLLMLFSPVLAEAQDLVCYANETNQSCPGPDPSYVPPVGPDWTRDLVTGFGAGPTAYYRVGSTHVVFSTVGGKLYATNGENEKSFWGAVPGTQPGNCFCTVGTQCCQPFGGAPIYGAVAPATLSGVGPGTGDFLFVANSDGRLYKVNAQTGALVTDSHSGLPLDLRRSGCPTDHLKATPLVQLARLSSPTFKSVYGNHDLIYIPTAYDTGGTCGTTTDNQVIAVDAQTMDVKWRFGGPGQISLNEFSAGCDIDYGADTIFCGARQVHGGAQMTLVALQVYNTSDPNPQQPLFKWSKNAGDLLVRPRFHSNLDTQNVYVGNGAGQVKSYNAVTGAFRWTTQLTVAAPGTVSTAVGRDFVVAGKLGDGCDRNIFAVTADRRLHRLLDTRCAGGLSCGVESWWRGTANGSPAGIVTAPVLDPAFNKIYIGESDGKIHQLNMRSGVDEGGLTVSGGIATMGDAAAEIFDSAGAEGSICYLNRLSVLGSNGVLAGFRLPFTSTGPPPDTHLSPQQSQSFLYTVSPGPSQVTFSSTWPGSDVVMSLTSPSGRQIDRSIVAADVVHDLGPTYEIYTVTYAEPGNWQVNLFGADVSPGGEDVRLDVARVEMPLPVQIDIKPGESPNKIQVGADGTLPVAILSTTSFDAGTVDAATVNLAGAPTKLKQDGTPQAALQDVNYDGRLDLVVHVVRESMMFSEDDTTAVLGAQTRTGARIRGVDSVQPIFK